MKNWIAFLRARTAKPVPTVRVFTDQPGEILLWPDLSPDIPGEKTNPVTRIEPDGLAVMSNIHKPSIIPFLPDASRATGAAVIIIPGGSHRELWIDHEGYLPAQWLCEKGIAAFVLKYRLSRDAHSKYDIYNHSLADLQQAIRLVRSGAGAWAIDPEKIGVLGFSAGGQLAAFAAIHHDDGDKSAPDLIGRQSSYPNFQALIYTSHIGNFKVRKNSPPLFLSAGFRDHISLIKEMTEMYLAYRKADVPAELHFYAGAEHGYGVRPGNTGPVAGWLERFQEWVEDVKP